MRPANIASLPWYRFQSTRPILDSVWKAVAATLSDAGLEDIPACLDHTTPHHKLLGCPSLLLSQCCGPDLFEEPAAKVIPFAAPIISAYGVDPGYYLSYIVTGNSPNLKRPRVAVNSRSSHSGYTAITQWLNNEGIEDYAIHETGSHAQSAKELQATRADIAAIDALSWRFIDHKSLQIIDNSKPALAPPFIAASGSKVPQTLFVLALDRAFKQHGKPMGISGAVAVTKSDYEGLAI